MKINPKVSVVVITYMHESFIRNAIDGILNQKCEFDYEIIISDDCSKDKTCLIIKDIISNDNCKKKIHFIERSENIGYVTNFFDTLKKCNSKYIAICEGDDYWIDPYKLQKQVDFLEQNLSFNMCFHNATECFNGLKLNKPHTNLNKNILSIEDFINNHFVATASIVFRNNLDFPKWVYNIKSCDKLIIFLCAIKGPIYYINEIMSHYRVHDLGVSRSEIHRGLNKVYHMSVLYTHLDEYSNGIYQELFKKGLEYKIGMHLLEPYKKAIKTTNLIKEIFIRLGIKFFNYKRS